MEGIGRLKNRSQSSSKFNNDGLETNKSTPIHKYKRQSSYPKHAAGGVSSSEEHQAWNSRRNKSSSLSVYHALQEANDFRTIVSLLGIQGEGGDDCSSQGTGSHSKRNDAAKAKGELWCSDDSFLFQRI